ncbi:hypothetical protein BCR32DRAFT_279006 [Anaeromyces robustus]|uniref:CCHC-type domain-containing protein n=1 Tax=Anaeromyces robustus TaxID=1754192 RepID=A0A1Y1XAA6_9FUNG|nr:hypothetical protein BCR32DRAFT_279006 [Anaeromyces robustus]|eukprot:ORX82284.1 hypothetical protein BCR32DRAFT_279006 [Anaeromyces robustus]
MDVISLRKAFEIAEKVDRLITRSDDDFSDHSQFNSYELTKKMQKISINVCFFCKEEEHYQPECPKLKAIIDENLDQVEEKFEEKLHSDSDNLKAQNDSERNESPKEKKVHRSLKDDPRPIATPALRKRKENELRKNQDKLKNLLLKFILQLLLNQKLKRKNKWKRSK